MQGLAWQRQGKSIWIYSKHQATLILEWVQDSIAFREVNGVFQYLSPSSPSSSCSTNQSNQNSSSGSECTVLKGTKFDSVVDSDEFSKRASETLVEGSMPFSDTLWNAPEEEDPAPYIQRCVGQVEQAASPKTDHWAGPSAFTLLGTGAVQGPSETNIDTID